MKFTRKQAGFALFEIFLAVILLTLISIASYKMLSSSESNKSVQTLESNVLNISQALNPIVNQTAVSDESKQHLFDDSSAKLLTDFLRSVPIADSQLSTPDDSYSYLLAGMFVTGKQSQVGFKIATRTTGGDNTRYLVAGFKANYAQATKIIQDMNNSLGVFIGDEKQDFSSIGDSATTLPRCIDKNCIYNIYLISPKLNNSNDVVGSFTAPDLTN